jgi:hypothetical protein
MRQALVTRLVLAIALVLLVACLAFAAIQA